jgi:glycyl-tRNA synthetase beta chain
MKTSAPFLFEIGCEEIPAGMLPGAMKELKVILEKRLTEERLLDSASVDVMATPRRLMAACDGLRVRQEDIEREVTGPPRTIAFDAAGKPTRAAESFAAKQGIAVASLYIVSTPRGECVTAKQRIVGRPAAEILSEILPKVIGEISWPKTMYWTGISGVRFIRPIRWIVALLGSKTIRFEIASVRAGDWTVGHRFLGQSKIPVTGAQDYVAKLQRNFVIVQPEKRREKVEKEMAKVSSSRHLKVNADAGLLEMVTFLNEYPTVILGGFDPAYLELPEEVLITVMRGHQKYFALRDGTSRLAPHFLAVINMAKDAKGLVRAGHERVLRARFADARFFWQSDQKCRLADNLEKLKVVTFQVKLGTYFEKVERVRAIAKWLAEKFQEQNLSGASIEAADRAALLAKCDLVTGMVGEFSELQGVMGGLYAAAQDESDDVSQAVYDHYLPTGFGDSLPRNLTGATVALADKLDTLAGCFSVGLAPTGSSDPFALRRAALGVVLIILERQLRLSIKDIVASAVKVLLESKPKLQIAAGVEKALSDFLLERARFIFQQRDGFALDEINAALAAASDDLVDAAERIRAIREIRLTANFGALAVSFKRIRKILEKAGPKESWQLAGVNQDLFEHDAERALHQAAQQVARQAEGHKQAGRYREALQQIAALRPEVDQFFDRVMVNAERDDVRRNRLTLLLGLLGEFSTIADFSELAPPEK